MSELFEWRRTGWDVALGALLAVLGVVILANAAITTTASVLFLGWLMLIAGVAGLVASLFRIGKGGFWSAALSGGLLTVLGLVFLRHTGGAAVTLTLIAGTVILISGIVRLIAAANEPEYRVALVLSGVVSTVLGLIVLLNLVTASYFLLGILIGVQVLVDGITMMIVGRPHAEPTLKHHPGVATP